MNKLKIFSSLKFNYLERKPWAIIALFTTVFLVVFAITMGGIVLSIYVSEASIA